MTGAVFSLAAPGNCTVCYILVYRCYSLVTWLKALGASRKKNSRGSTPPWFWSRGQVGRGTQAQYNAATGPYWPKGARAKKKDVENSPLAQPALWCSGIADGLQA